MALTEISFYNQSYMYNMLLSRKNRFHVLHIYYQYHHIGMLSQGDAHDS